MTAIRSLRQVRWSREHLAGVAVLCALLLLVLPVPPAVLDMLLTVNLAFGLAVLVVALLAEGPTGFVALPGVLVAGSLVRVALALGVARSILAHGGGGSLVRTLGGLLTSGGEGLVVGVATVGLLMLAAYLVLNLGLMRLAEVAARFALDALPGRQMALDNALSGGRMDGATGALETQRLQAQNAFYGAMDGAARFLRGETLALVIVTALIPLAGLATAGATSLAWSDLIVLTLGQSVLVLVPGLLMAAAAAIVLSRSEAGATSQGVRHALLQPGLMVTVAVALLALAIVPGLAKAPLLAGALIAGLAAWRLSRPGTAAEEAVAEGHQLRLALGMGLVGMTTKQDLPRWLRTVRLSLSDELGFAIPSIVVSDDAALEASDFAVSLDGTPLLTATLRPGRRLVVAPAEGVLPPEGDAVMLPDGRPATWLREVDEEALKAAGYHLLEPLEALGLYLRSVVRDHAADLFDLQAAHELLDAVRVTHRVVVEAYEAAGLKAIDLRNVGRALLAERVPLAERGSLLEAMAEAGPEGTARLVEQVRPALRRTITRLVAPEGTLCGVELEAALQGELTVALGHGAPGEPVVLAPERAEAWRELLREVEGRYAQSPGGAVVLCPAELRAAVAQLAAEAGAAISVVQLGELQPLTELQVLQVPREDQTTPMPQAAGEWLS